MDDKDPPPFGYTFSGDFFGGSPTGTGFDNGGPSLLSEMESQSLTDFFSHTNPWLPEPAPAPFAPTTEPKEPLDDYGSWSFVPPPTIHRVSTTIPDQSHLHTFHPEQNLGLAGLPASHLPSTTDDLQAATTLFPNAHLPQQQHARAYSYHGLPTASTSTRSHSTDIHGVPLVPTSQGLMLNEQLAALLPNHDEDGSIDAQLASQFISVGGAAQHRRGAELRELGIRRAPLKRSYTYGTDSAFNETGFQVTSPTETEEHVTRRLLSDLAHASKLAEEEAIAQDKARHAKSESQSDFPTNLVDIPSDDDGQSEDGTSDDEEDDDRPTKKRRKSKVEARNRRVNGGIRKTRSGKNHKTPVDDPSNKKKRGSVAGQKAHRENLTEEQKRNNHILSEQKRRNLIKRGFDDLHELVPELKNGSLSKSSVLMESANFLEKIIADNIKYLQIIEGAGG